MILKVKNPGKIW